MKDILDNYKTKVEEARLFEESIQKRAFAQARQIVRKRLSEQHGAEYSNLVPTNKAAVDSALNGKVSLVKKIAQKLVPKIRQANGNRADSFARGKSLVNQGHDEYGEVKETINSLFSEKFGNKSVEVEDEPVVQKDEKKELKKPKGKAVKSSPEELETSADVKVDIKGHNPGKNIKYYEKFSEQAESVENIVMFFEDYMKGNVDTPNFDMLLRIGLVPEKDLPLYRRALINPENSVADPYLRAKLIFLMRKIINVTVGDSVIYNRVRMNVQSKQHNELSIREAITKKSNKSGISTDILSEVYNRGMEAWVEDMSLSQQQYAFARVNSYIKQGKTYFNEDVDLHDTLKNVVEDEDESDTANIHTHPIDYKMVKKRIPGVNGEPDKIIWSRQKQNLIDIIK